MTGSTQPSTTSSSWEVSKLWRCCRLFNKPDIKLTGVTVCSAPSFLPRPRGVRTASKIYASVIFLPLILLTWTCFASLLFSEAISATRREYIHVGSYAPSMAHRVASITSETQGKTVLHSSTQSANKCPTGELSGLARKMLPFALLGNRPCAAWTRHSSPHGWVHGESVS